MCWNLKKVNMCKAYLESPVWAWGKCSFVMQGQAVKFWSSFHCVCSATWNPVLCLVDLSACDNCVLFNKVFICSPLHSMHCGRNITERFINIFCDNSAPLVVAVEKFSVAGPVLNQNKMADFMFYLKSRGGFYGCSVETSPRKVLFLLAVCCVEYQ